MANPFSDVKTLIAFAERAYKFGFSTSDLQPSIDDHDQLRRIVEYIKAGAPSVLLPGLSYDASSILNFGQPMQGTLPQAVSDEIVIWYGGWSLQQLRDNTLVRKRNIMHDQDWYNEYDWSTEVLPAGFYRLRLPIQDSNRKTFDEQTELLTNGEEVAHPVLVVTAELCHYLQTGQRLLKGIWVRTSKQFRDGRCVVLRRHEGRLFVGYWFDNRYVITCLASARDCT